MWGASAANGKESKKERKEVRPQAWVKEAGRGSRARRRHPPNLGRQRCQVKALAAVSARSAPMQRGSKCELAAARHVLRNAQSLACTCTADRMRAGFTRTGIRKRWPC